MGRQRLEKGCKIEDCKRKYHAIGYCHVHYQRIRLKGSPGSKEIRVKLPNGFRQHHFFKSIGSMNKKRFGGLREFIIQRDGEKCVSCGMSRLAHRLSFNCDLTINHIDHQSSRSSRFDGYINNDPDNLETLCIRDLGMKSALKHGKYSKRLGEINAIKKLRNL